jgi:hypothetical protein
VKIWISARYDGLVEFWDSLPTRYQAPNGVIWCRAKRQSIAYVPKSERWQFEIKRVHPNPKRGKK